MQQLIQAYGVVTGSSNSATQLGLLPPSQWKIYALTSTPGMHGTLDSICTHNLYSQIYTYMDPPCICLSIVQV